jgi:predicted component of type VI protein secretion system
MNSAKVAAALGVIALAIAVLLASGGRQSSTVAVAPAADPPPAMPAPPGVAPTAAPPERPAPSATPPAPPQRPSAKTGTVPARDEVALMQMLRDLGGSNPELSLELAREGKKKYGDTTDAAEREWFIVRSLMNLSRVDEARVEARLLLDKYPRSTFAEDVHRHMFVNPPTHPEERGYGKTTELGP